MITIANPKIAKGAPPSPFQEFVEGGSWVFLRLTETLARTSWPAFIRLPILVLATVALILAGCGYHVAGHNDALPQSIRVIAVPALENTTTSYRIEQRLTSATVHEFLAKTQYRVVSRASDGDAVLRGKILSLEAVPLLFDTTSGRATTMLVTVKCDVTLTQTATDKILYHADTFIFRNQYEISTNVTSFFEEQDPALDRLAHDFAARLVAAVTENY
jgi:outer membrane lipopolysaccharide assembly protein LptE/RlpB